MNDGTKVFKIIAKIVSAVFGIMSLWLILIIAAVVMVVAAAAGSASDHTMVGDASTDVCYKSVAEVQQELTISNSINVNLVKASMSIAGKYTNEPEQIKKFVKEYYIKKTAEATTSAGGTATSATYEFLSDDEIKAALKKPPFNFDDKKIEQIFQIAENGIRSSAPTNGKFAFPFQQEHYISCAYGPDGRRFHGGIDITCVGALGKPIYAAEAGTVQTSSSSVSYGNSIVITHSLQLKTRYAHMLSFAVKDGQSVGRGQLIGYCGSTGNSSGPHLHFEVILNGVTVDPTDYIMTKE